MPSSSAENRLVERALAGDRAAFGDLYERHLPAIYRYIFYRIGDQAEAEDLTETVFLHAWEALDRYHPSEFPFTAWLYRIAHNLCIDWRRTHRPTVELLEQEPDPVPEDSLEAQVAARTEARILGAALAKLEPLQQQVLTLRFVSGLSHTEAAAVLGRTAGAVRVLQHRALAALRNILTHEGAQHD